MIYICNSFTISMLNNINDDITLSIKRVNIDTVKEIVANNEVISAIGHNSTVEVVNKLLGTNFTMNRIQISMNSDDLLIVFQLLVRLEEGRILDSNELMNLPTSWFIVRIIDNKSNQ